MEVAEPEAAKALSRSALRQTDVLNRIQLLKDDADSRSFAFSHGYVLFRSRIITVLSNILPCGLVTFFLFSFMDSLKAKFYIPTYHFLGLNFSRAAVGSTFILTSVFTVDTALLLRGVGAGRRFVLTILSVTPMAIFLALILHWAS